MAESSFGRPSGFYTVGIVVNVEDDPSQTGQAKVRWFEGGASQDTMSEADLPWTRCLFPVTNPSLMQTGGPHTGLRVGTRVYGTTVDGAGQEYMIIGTAPPAGTGMFDQAPFFDSDLPQSGKIQNNGGETQPRFGDINAIVAQESLVTYAETKGGPFGAALFPGLPDSIGFLDEAITA